MDLGFDTARSEDPVGNVQIAWKLGVEQGGQIGVEAFDLIGGQR